MHNYPRRPEQRVFEGGQIGNLTNENEGWMLSSDIGCAFIALEGLVNVAIETGRDDLKALIWEMFDVFRGIDLVAISAQLHSSLTAARTFLLFHAIAPDQAIIDRAKRVYALFREQAITENYANYNWFGRPSWTEPCAIVDAFALAVDLWRHTGDPRYINDAHHMYYNALGVAQKPHGGFGCDCCVGSDSTFLQVHYYDVVGCCNMRGSVGLSHAVECTYACASDTLTIPFYFDSRADIAFPDGKLTLAQQTTYPLEGNVTITVKSSTLAVPKTLRMFIPEWADHAAIRLRLNGRPVSVEINDGFAMFRHQLRNADRLELGFPLGLRTEKTMNANNLQGLITYRHGPLILGAPLSDAYRDRQNLIMKSPGTYTAQGTNPITLNPINSVFRLTEEAATRQRTKILFR